MISLCKDVLAQGIETFMGIIAFLFPQIRFYLNTGVQICGIQVLWTILRGIFFSHFFKFKMSECNNME